MMDRRSVIGMVTLGAAAVASPVFSGSATASERRESHTTVENRAAGDTGWQVSPTISDRTRHIQGYASATSVNVGETIDFHVTVRTAQPVTVHLYRIGHYDGAGARLLHSSATIAARPQRLPKADPETGLITCGWPVAWRFTIPDDWVSGLFVAVFETRDGLRGGTPFVVRNDGRRSDFHVVVPFTTYAAYNLWPADGRVGKSLYQGYLADGSVGGAPERALQVSLDRPFSGGGMPRWFELDVAVAQWAESEGYDVTYATSVDLHEGRVDPAQHRALIFSGHDEYWSGAMRDVVERAIRGGTHCAFLAANNVYWNIRLAGGRVVTCYKGAPDPAGRTQRWRDIDQPEARLLGVQYNGILHDPVPLVVTAAGHWLWAGTGLRDGDKIEDLVCVEADGSSPDLPTAYDAEQTLLSHSPYTAVGGGRRAQETSVCETPEGTLMFCAGTFHWPLALVDSPVTDARVQRATRNLFDRMIS